MGSEQARDRVPLSPVTTEWFLLAYQTQRNEIACVINAYKQEAST